MRKFFNIILCASFALFSASCNQAEEKIEMGENEGILALDLDFVTTRAIDAAQPFELKIYRYADEQKSDVELIRKYTQLSDIPQYIWLIQDTYYVQVKYGEKVLASFNDRYYFGQSADFDIVAGQIIPVKVDCKLTNIPVKVNYDQSVASYFTGGFYTYVCAANSFNLEDAEAGNVPTLKYTESKTGYFILPDGCTNLCWYFYGNNGTNETVRQSVIQGIEADKLYSLNFKFSPDAPGHLIISATIDTTVEHRDDKVPFSPDPTVKGDGFDIDTPYNYTGGTYTYKIAALDTINKITVSCNNATYNLIGGNTEGIALTKISAKEYTVALSEPFFNTLPGGTQTIIFRVNDASGGVGYQESVCTIQGVLPVTSYDLWQCIADVAAVYFADGNVTIGYRKAGESEWTKVATTAAGAANTYNATIPAFAGCSYECVLFVNDAQVGLATQFTTAAGPQIPESDFESWSQVEKAYYPAADKNNATWDTGNPAVASYNFGNLTTPSSTVRPGSTGQYSALMESKLVDAVVVKMFAAGNLFVGQFLGTVGTKGGKVKFGKYFNFTARPKAIRFWIKNEQGTINQGSHTTGTDLAKIYCCFTDHEFVVDTTDESTFFTPDITTEGIYGAAYWESTESGDWRQIELPIVYREDMTTKPTFLLLTFTCSGYGDYFTGSTDSKMYIDDVELVY